MILVLDRQSHTPLYAQITAQVRQLIASGALTIGDRLPADRVLASTLGVNRTTVATAYSELTADGLISSHVGRGTFVSTVPARVAPAKSRPVSAMQWETLLAAQAPDKWLSGMPRPAYSSQTISLAYSLPSIDLLPIEDFRRSVDRVLRKEGAALLDSADAGGYPPLQEWLASRMALEGASVRPDEVIVTSGCQQSLNLVREVLAAPGDEIAIEAPTYPGAISVFCGNHLKHVPIPVTDEGLDVDVVEQVVSHRRVKLIYTTPSFQNPTGTTMSVANRLRLLEVAARYNVPIIEDDIYHDLHYGGPATPSLKSLDRHGLVIYLNSFSKIGLPGLRVGWIAAPEGIAGHLAGAKRRADLHTSLIGQAAILDFSRRGLMARHVYRIKKAYASRRDAMLEAMRQHFPAGTSWSEPAGGMAIWVRLAEGLDAQQVLIESSAKGVIFSPGSHFYPGHFPPNSLRLSFAPVNPAQIEEGIKRLGVIIKMQTLNLKRRHRLGPAQARPALV